MKDMYMRAGQRNVILGEFLINARKNPSNKPIAIPVIDTPKVIGSPPRTKGKLSQANFTSNRPPKVKEYIT